MGVVPAAVTADRGYGESSVDDQLSELGVDLVAIPRKGKTGHKRQAIEAADDFIELVKWRTAPRTASPPSNASTAAP